MKKLIALLFCFAVMATVARAEFPKTEYPQSELKTEVPSLREQIAQPRKTQTKWAAPVAQRRPVASQTTPQKKATVQQAVTQRVQAAQQAPVQIAGKKRLLTVRLELQQLQDNEEYLEHRYWYCPAVIFTKEGALAFDGECWKAFEEAAKLPVGPIAIFLVDLGNFGDYTTGEHFGESFYFRATYVADGPGDEYTHSVDESFARSADKSYIIYKRSLFNPSNPGEDPDNSEVKKAIANYYAENNLKEVTAETLSKYFKQKHATTKTEFTRFP